jgi:hypothetical protein
MTDISDNDLADLWISYTLDRRPPEEKWPAGDQDELTSELAATMALDELCGSTPERALQVIDTIAERSADPWVLENLGAGPLESLIDHSWEIIRVPLQAALSRNARLSIALESVWSSDRAEEIAGLLKQRNVN